MYSLYGRAISVIVLVILAGLAFPAVVWGAADFAVYANDQTNANRLVDLIRAGGKTRAILSGSLHEAVRSKANVVVAMMEREDKADPADIAALKNRKVIGIGYGAAEMFGGMRLDINGGGCAHDPTKEAPVIVLEKNELAGEPGRRLVAYRVKEPKEHIDYNFGLFLPPKSPETRIVEAVARNEGDANYAPVVRQGNCVMIGLAAPVDTWTPEYKQLFQRIAFALRARPDAPLPDVEREITQPGTYDFKLGKAFGTESMFERDFYFRFSRPTQITARLKHSGSNPVMLHFLSLHGGRLNDRRDSNDVGPLEMTKKITAEDIEAVGNDYWRLNVTNFDRDHEAECHLEIKY